MNRNQMMNKKRKINNTRKDNLREAYLNYVKNQQNKPNKLSISNIDLDSSTGGTSSQYLENEYSLVKKILTATRELENLKLNTNEPKAQISSSSLTSNFVYKTQDEYYQEILDLKKIINNLERNEQLTKAKLDYYENELSKKNLELENLIDNKLGATDTLNLSKLDNGTNSAATILSLKKKLYRLENQLKRKENELKKLEQDLKTTDSKELRVANNLLKQEVIRLNETLKNSVQNIAKELTTNRNFEELKALQEMNLRLTDENKILKAQLFKASSSSVTSINDSKELSLRDNHIIKLKNDIDFYKRELHSKDSLIRRLKEEIDNLKDGRTSSRLSQQQQHYRKSPSNIQDALIKAIDKNIQQQDTTTSINIVHSVFKGHAERVKYLNEMDDEYNNNRSLSRSNSRLKNNEEFSTRVNESKSPRPNSRPSSRQSDSKRVTISSPKKQEDKHDDNDDIIID